MLDSLSALLQVIFIDVVLAGDNAIVVGMAAAAVPKEQRRKVIFWGIAAAVVLRIIFALLTTQLLAIIGLTLAGGVLLLWVCWKLWREIQQQRLQAAGTDLLDDGEADPALLPPDKDVEAGKSMGVAIRQIIAADVSMSLDNVLAVAGAAQDHAWVLVVGLLLSVALMGAAASIVARLMERHHWIAYIGLGVIGYVALKMIYDGGFEVLHALAVF